MVLTILVLLLSSCASDAEPLDTEVARQFDIPGNRIADLTPADGAEDVRRDVLLQTIADADAAGTALRIVVAAPEGEFVPAKSVVDRYGGTVISYQANRTSFEGASRDMSAGQLDRAIDAARLELDIGDSAAAFVDVIEVEGLEKRGASFLSKIIVPLLLVAAAFMLWGAYSYVTARNRRRKRQAAFEERKRVLADWAGQLGPEVESLRGPVVAADDAPSFQIWQEAQEFVSTIVPTVESARSLGELDAAEMRIGRTAIKLRDLRSSLG